METKEITLVKNAIHRPEEPRHFMRIKEVKNLVTAFYKGAEIAKSSQALKLQEVGFDLYDPVYYFPNSDVRQELLIESEKTTKCPLKGEAKYFHLQLEDQLIKDVAWKYVQPFPRSEVLKDYIAFDHRKIQLVERINSEK